MGHRDRHNSGCRRSLIYFLPLEPMVYPRAKQPMHKLIIAVKSSVVSIEHTSSLQVFRQKNSADFYVNRANTLWRRPTACRIWQHLSYYSKRAFSCLYYYDIYLMEKSIFFSKIPPVVCHPRLRMPVCMERFFAADSALPVLRGGILPGRGCRG